MRIPSHWYFFLRVVENKQELFKFFIIESTSIQTEKLVISTQSNMMLFASNIDSSSFTTCSQEEADSFMFLHVKHARIFGSNKLMTRIVDTDVLYYWGTFFDLGCVKYSFNWVWVETTVDTYKVLCRMSHIIFSSYFI